MVVESEGNMTGSVGAPNDGAAPMKKLKTEGSLLPTLDMLFGTFGSDDRHNKKEDSSFVNIDDNNRMK